MRYLRFVARNYRQINKRFSFNENNTKYTSPVQRWLNTNTSNKNEQNNKPSSFGNYDPNKTRTDMEEMFLDNRVRFLLKRLTGFDLKKLFEKKSLENLKSPKYRFMTDEQLRMEKELADQKADKMLQMPPVLYSKSFETKVFEKDNALQGFLDPSVKLIFLDATPGFSDIDRLIVVREADGTLREATREERHRTNQIFYPVEERHIDKPKMFEEPYIEDVLNNGSYKLLLDNACLHFEPEDPQYTELCHKIYEHIALKSNFDNLWSTRHYGGMVYYFVFYKRSDSLLHHLLSSNRFEDSYNLLRLYYIVNKSEQVPDSVTSQFDSTQLSTTSFAKANSFKTEFSTDQLIDLLKIYITNDSNSSLKPRLQLIAQKLQENKDLIDTEEKSAAQN